jgi:hypothetical protein
VEQELVIRSLPGVDHVIPGVKLMVLPHGMNHLIQGLVLINIQVLDDSLVLDPFVPRKPRSSLSRGNFRFRNSNESIVKVHGHRCNVYRSRPSKNNICCM